jgi:hypothetical protein
MKIATHNVWCFETDADPCGVERAALSGAPPAESNTSNATPLRMARISKMLQTGATIPRMDTAMIENESNAPIIQSDDASELMR